MTSKVSVLGAGTMGAGIAQVALQSGYEVCLYDISSEQLSRAKSGVEFGLGKLLEKKRISEADRDSALIRFSISDHLETISGSDLVIEAVIEDLGMKRDLFERVEGIVSSECILATNTSSLSVTSIFSKLKEKERSLGLHFFNPAPILPLVEVVRGFFASDEVCSGAVELMKAWGKDPVVTSDTPGFIVNRVARPFYGEALKLLEEGIADVPTIDWAMKELAGFRMGPFELMDLIGIDVNLAVSKTVFYSFFCDPRYRPSIVQERMVDAGLLGRKSGQGFYLYGGNDEELKPTCDEKLGKKISIRIICMLINEAVDALYHGVATKEDLDTAMQKGVNYPKGLLAWCDDLGAKSVVDVLDGYYVRYRDPRYRASVLLRDMAQEGQKFFE